METVKKVSAAILVFAFIFLPKCDSIAEEKTFSDKPLVLSKGSVIQQEVTLDPQEPPGGLMMVFFTAAEERTGVYWEGHGVVFDVGDTDPIFYYGELPETGKPVTLRINADDLGMPEAAITKIVFTVDKGKAEWGQTTLVPPEE